MIQGVGVTMKIQRVRFKGLLSILWLAMSLNAQTRITPQDIVKPVQARNGMVVTSEPLATQVGVHILEAGGNAVDAAVAVGYALAVTLPRAGNIGGGGFMLVYSARTGEVTAIDYRETAPVGAHRDMYLDDDGAVDTELVRHSHLASGVPGTVAGLNLALQQFGTMSLSELIDPAIRLAEEGFIVSPELGRSLESASRLLGQWASSRKVFYKSDASVYESGDRFVQPDLAKTLSAIRDNGPDVFYAGAIADLIVREMAQHGGLITKTDLAGYIPVVRKPVHGTYRGYDVYSMAPPSSGGPHIVQMLNILEGFDLSASGHNTAAAIHLMTEVMKRAYADRSKYLGDPGFIRIPLDGILSKSYAADLRKTIDPARVTPSSAIAPGHPPGAESTETTHFSIVDQWGNAVSNTYTINFSYGSGIVVEGAGFLLNNEMDDFSARPGFPNDDGLVGGEANSIAPRKRMLSSMSPTIILKDGRPFLVTGSPGGSRIITTTLQIILNVIDYGMNVQEAVNAPRMHHQWLPDVIRLEEGFSADTIRLLKEMGYVVKIGEAMGSTNSIHFDPVSGWILGAADPRRSACAAGH